MSVNTCTYVYVHVPLVHGVRLQCFSASLSSFVSCQGGYNSLTPVWLIFIVIIVQHSCFTVFVNKSKFPCLLSGSLSLKSLHE